MGGSRKRPAMTEDRKLAALVEEALRRWLKGRDVKEEGT